MSIYRGAAGVIVFNHDSSQVVILESKRKGNYSFPKGSHERGETWEETAIRELREESGIDRSDIDLIENQQIDEIRLKNSRICVRYLIGRSDKQKLTAENPEEVLFLGWMTIENALKVLNKQRGVALEKAVGIVNT